MDVIGELLRSSLLTEIGDHEDRVKRVRAASSDLAGRFNSDLCAQVPNAIIAAVDEATPGEVGVMQVADEALTAH